MTMSHAKKHFDRIPGRFGIFLCLQTAKHHSGNCGDFDHPDFQEYFVKDALDKEPPIVEPDASAAPSSYGQADAVRACSDDLDDFFRVSQILVQQIGRAAMKHLLEAHLQRPSGWLESPNHSPKLETLNRKTFWI